MNYATAYQWLGLLVVACPLLLVVLMGLASMFFSSLSERSICFTTQLLVTTALCASLAVLVMMLAHGERVVVIRPWNWVSVADGDAHPSAPAASTGAPALVGGDRTHERTEHERTHTDPVTHDAYPDPSPTGVPSREASHATPSRDRQSSGSGDPHTPSDGVEEHAHFHFEVKFVFDRLSVAFVLLTLALCSTIGAFARSYLHREPGFRRFFVLFSLFLLGMVVSALAGSIETLFTGWELVGLSSALLVAFYQDRAGPVQNGLRVWGVYRIADAAFLVAAIALHRMAGEGDFASLMGPGAWPQGVAAMTAKQAFYVGLLLLVAAAGKSALIPFSGWLPRAMEGPTPSSAIFYGALSVHLGAYMLLRLSPILDASPLLSGLVVALGLSTSAFAALTARVQTDIKSSLSFASLTQVGLIVAEIGFGWRYLALTHLLGHACLRTLQLVRAPSLLLDYQRMRNAVGVAQSRADHRARPRPEFRRLYRFGMQRGFLDHWLDQAILRPYQRFFLACNRWEQNWTDWLSHSPPRSELTDAPCVDDDSTDL